MATYEAVTYDGNDGAQIGQSGTEKVGFYGKVPVVRRTFNSALHVSSNLASSASVGATQLAVLQEIQNTLIGLGIWATA